MDEPTKMKLHNGIQVLNEDVSATFFKLILIDGAIFLFLGMIMLYPPPRWIPDLCIILGFLTVIYCQIMISKIRKRVIKINSMYDEETKKA